MGNICMSVEDVSPSPRMISPLNKSFSPNAAAIKAAEEEENKTYELNDPEELILDLKKHKTTLQEKIRGVCFLVSLLVCFLIMVSFPVETHRMILFLIDDLYS